MHSLNGADCRQSEENPACQEADATERGNCSQEAVTTDSEGIETAGEEQDACREEPPCGRVQAISLSPTHKDPDEQQRDGMNQVVLYAGLVDIQHGRGKSLAQEMRPERSKCHTKKPIYRAQQHKPLSLRPHCKPPMLSVSYTNRRVNPSQHLQ